MRAQLFGKRFFLGTTVVKRKKFLYKYDRFLKLSFIPFYKMAQKIISSTNSTAMSVDDEQQEKKQIKYSLHVPFIGYEQFDERLTRISFVTCFLL